jgi:dTDP-4-amino-4,6-dideoxygalactose transaminase
MKKIEFLDLKEINKGYENSFNQELLKILTKGWFILGENVSEFEKEYAAFSNSKFCIGVANGLDALTISLKVLGIGPGDEVIVPSNTYIASWLAVTHIGATPVPVEPNLMTYNIDPKLIEDKITPSTKAIMAVNLYGQACELDKIKEICTKYSIYLVEDNAQAQGATCNNILTGSYGDISGTSFYPGKNLGAIGDAGAITTDNYLYMNKASVYRNYGSRVKYFNECIGYNSRLDELQAAFLRVKLKDLISQNNYRVSLANTYIELLKKNINIILPKLANGCTSIYHIFMIRTKNRDSLQKFLQERNIQTMIHYPLPPHLQEAYKSLNFKKGDFPISEEIAETCLSLPMGPHLTYDDIEYVADNINSFFQ